MPYWGAFDEDDLRSERCFLKLDLIFPVLFGAALVFGLLMAWVMLGRPFPRVWLLMPVSVAALVDWTENLVQLVQLRRFVEGGEMALQSGWIEVASAATVVKLFFFTGASVLLLALVVSLVLRSRSSAWIDFEQK